MPNYRMRAAGKTGEVLIYDDIGDGLFGGIGAKQFADDLNSLGRIDVLNVRINSPGGDVFQGLAIFNTLKRHPARVVVDVDGMALSIASIIAMAGDEIHIAKNAMMMIHEPYSGMFGTAQDLRKQADLMDQVRDNLVQTYVDRTGLKQSQLLDMVVAETWMTATEAVEFGFADRVTEDLAIAAHFDASRFKNTPRKLANARARPRADMHRARLAALSARAKQICGFPPQ